MPKLTHADDDGSPQMVDISGKAATSRSAVVEGLLLLQPVHREALGSLPKGDALTVAKIAGIQGGKRCFELIPLCHAVELSHLGVELNLEPDGIRIVAEARCDGRTGVEMEAYCAVAIAGVTLIDMLKGVSPELELTGVRLRSKTGGKSDFRRAH